MMVSSSPVSLYAQEGDTVKLIESADGTRIALDRSGGGPPLVIVLGACCDRSTSKPLAALLAPSYTVYEYDRRGRGDSGSNLRSLLSGPCKQLRVTPRSSWYGLPPTPIANLGP
jgi:pimeloyl-ACP methyl ester carboxylesterase